MSFEPLVSVVIPNHNYGRYLGQAIDSVLAQSYPAVDILVVDDGSGDDSEAVVRRYGDRVRWIRQQRQGVSAARNRGVQESRGELIAFLDADDLWYPDKLARQVERFDRPSVGMVYCGLRYLDETAQVVATNCLGASGWVLRDIALLDGPGVPASGSSAVVRTSCVERVGAFDTALSTSADWDMWRRIACHYEIELVREPLAGYRLHGVSMHHNVEALERDMLRAFAKMFVDPAAAAVWRERRHCYARLYLMLSGSYFHARRGWRSLVYALRSLWMWPPSLGYLADFPLRRMRGRLPGYVEGVE